MERAALDTGMRLLYFLPRAMMEARGFGLAWLGLGSGLSFNTPTGDAVDINMGAGRTAAPCHIHQP